TTGNDNNTISFCDIGPAGTNLPAKAIYGNGTTTNTTTYNSGNQILNCNIFDYFHATAQSNGFYIGAGNTGMTVSNNKLYQTANRTQTSGAIHAGIQFASATGNDGNLVSGNTIGFANNAGTGTYTLVGASGTRVYPIYLSAVGTNTVNVVSGNTISNISVSGVLSGTSSSAPFIGIFFSSGLANAIGNTIGSGTANGAISFSSSSATASDVMAIYNFGSSATTVSTNIIGGITAGNTSTANVIIYGIRINTASAVVSTIQGNQIGGAVPNSIQNTTLVSTSSQAIGIQINLSIANIIGNTIGSMSVSGGNGTGSTPSVGGIVIGTSTPAHTVIGNTIAGIGNLNPASSGHVSGIVFNGSSGANLVAKNTIHSLVVTSAAATLNGIFVTGGTTTYANNMIRLGLDPTGASLTSGAAINGINETTAGTDNFYHNSVYIGGSGVGGAANTFAFQSSITTNTRNFQNNIFFNARSNGAGTGKHYAIRVGGIAPNPAGLTSNFNVLFANGTGGLVGLFNSIDQASISSWRIATGQDNNSISFNPGFVNPNGNGLTGDLHIAPGATPIEGAGVNIPAVTDDFDSQTRSGLTPTDIGADAGAFTALDVSPPNISYTPLTFTCTTGDRTLTATIADATGIPISGAFQPRIYYRKNADPYVSSQGVLSSGTANNGTWTFTISTAAMGGLVGGDVVSYYVIAQDDALPTPNVASNPSAGLVATDVNTVTTPPTTPSSYAISLTLSGTYTVGAAGDYPTLTAAVNAYNSNCLGGAVIFSLIDASYPGETFPITVLSNPDASAINTLTIKPTLTGTTITGSNVGGILNMSGADYVTIDGSIGTTANTVCPLSAATRDLTITNTLSSTSTAVVWLSTTAGGNPVTNCTVKNCIISGLSPSTTLLGLGAGGPGIGAAGTNNDNISFVNNEVRACQVGIYSSGATAINKNQNLTINQNLLNAVAPNNIGFSGIYAAFTNNITVSGNVVSNVSNTASTDVSAINIGFGAVGGFLATTTGIADGVSNVTITNNTIGSILQSGTFSSVGIGLGNTLTGNFLIANNMIYGVAANATPGDLVAGILYGGGSGTVNVFNNSVWMQGTIPGASAGTSVSACFAVTSATAPAALNLRNNIFHNTQQGNTGSTMRFVTIGYQFPGPFTTASSNYNDLFSAGAGPGTYFVGTTAGLTAGTTAATLANWQTATSGDANSLNIAPVFVSSTDLHLIPASNSTINDLGTPVGGVTSDIDCATRSVSTPDMGADEFDPPVCAGTPIPGTATLSSSTICQGFPTTLSTTGYSTGVSGISFQWQTSTTIGGPYTNIPGATTPTFIYSGAAAGVNYIVCQVTCSNGGASALTNELTLTVNPSPVTSVTPANSSICLPGGSAVTLTASATGGTGVVNFTWNPTTDLTPSIGSPVSANPSVTTIYTVTGTDAIGCSSTATATVGVGSTVTIANVTATPSTICAGSTSVLDVEATV
ncbi:MAG TPA: hypothetical protein VHS96_05765, partial [Bacteroidia bacterium]|nr:hypothetical protein [Bacteroidia bacterium]